MAEHTSTLIEQWKPIVGFEGLYSISDRGRIRREHTIGPTKAGRILKTYPDMRGYHRVRLCRHSKGRFHSVHRILATAFLGPCPPGMQVNHKDTNKSNNCVANIEYVTDSENMRHAARAGVLGQAKLNCDSVRKIRTLLATEQTAKSIARQFGVSPQTILNIKHGIAWGHFEYPGIQPIAKPRKH